MTIDEFIEVEHLFINRGIDSNIYYTIDYSWIVGKVSTTVRYEDIPLDYRQNVHIDKFCDGTPSEELLVDINDGYGFTLSRCELTSDRIIIDKLTSGTPQSISPAIRFRTNPTDTITELMNRFGINRHVITQI